MEGKMTVLEKYDFNTIVSHQWYTPCSLLQVTCLYTDLYHFLFFKLEVQFRGSTRIDLNLIQ